MARVMSWFAQNYENQISFGVLAGQTSPSLISFCSPGKQKELTKNHTTCTGEVRSTAAPVIMQSRNYHSDV